MPKRKWIDSLFGQRRRTEVSADGERAIGGAIARKTDDTGFGSYFAPIVKRAGIVRSYKQLTQEVVRSLPDEKVRELIKAANPIVAKALADFADAVASGYTYTADYTMESTAESPARTLLDDFFKRMETDATGIETLLSEIGRGMFSHGGMFTELVIDTDGRTPLEIKSLDPTTAIFRPAYDRMRGDYYELGQEVSPLRDRTGRRRPRSRGDAGVYYDWISLEDDPTVQYRPIQSDPNQPYGVPIIDPAVFNVIMLAGMLSAVEAGILGYFKPNLLVSIDKELWQKFGGVTGSDQKVQDAFNKSIQDIVKQLEKMRAGQALVLGNEVSVGGSFSGSGGRPPFSIREVHDVIRRDLITAVQSQPVLMGSNEAVAETHAVIQRVLYARLIRKVQRVVAPVFKSYLNLILELNDYPPLADFQLNYENPAMYLEQAQTFSTFHEGLERSAQSGTAFVEFLQAAVEAEFYSEDEARLAWQEQMELRRQVDILPREL